MNRTSDTFPRIIQGGMGIGVSNWNLANAVSSLGQLGVVSGTALDSLFVRRLQDGDPGCHMRRAMERFPIPGVAERVLQKFFNPEGRAADHPYRALPMYRQVVDVFRHQVTMLANFVEITLAKEGHDNPVGINLLTKVQIPNLASLYGAMMAGVDYVLMGAGIPREIPGVLDRLAEHEDASLRLDVHSATSNDARHVTFSPKKCWTSSTEKLGRPRFLAIVSSHTLASMLVSKSSGKVDGFIVEAPSAGGHNAPPRGKANLNERGEPIYGRRDEVDLDVFRELKLPFWLAGNAGTAEQMTEALDSGATGIQVGTLFAYCSESGVSEALKADVIRKVKDGSIDILTDPSASPTGFPFKVVTLEKTLSEHATYSSRSRICDLGYLREPYEKADGKIGYRCASEPVDDYVRKGGTAEDAAGRKCLCNALMANVGHGQYRKDGTVELPLLTSGDQLKNLQSFLQDRTSYTASDVVAFLLNDVHNSAAGEHGHGHATFEYE